MSPFLTLPECASLLRMEASHLQRWARRGYIPARKHGQHWVFFEPDVMAWSISKGNQPSLSKFQGAKLRISSLTTEVTAQPSDPLKKRVV